MFGEGSQDYTITKNFATCERTFEVSQTLSMVETEGLLAELADLQSSRLIAGCKSENIQDYYQPRRYKINQARDFDDPEFGIISIWGNAVKPFLLMRSIFHG